MRRDWGRLWRAITIKPYRKDRSCAANRKTPPRSLKARLGVHRARGQLWPWHIVRWRLSSHHLLTHSKQNNTFVVRADPQRIEKINRHGVSMDQSLIQAFEFLFGDLNSTPDGVSVAVPMTTLLEQIQLRLSITRQFFICWPGACYSFARVRWYAAERICWRGSSHPMNLSAGRCRAPPSTYGSPGGIQISRRCLLYDSGQTPSSDMAWIPSGLSKAPCCTWLAERDPHPRSRNRA